MEQNGTLFGHFVKQLTISRFMNKIRTSAVYFTTVFSVLVILAGGVQEMEGLLDGVVVLDLGRVLACPYAATMMADMGVLSSCEMVEIKVVFAESSSLNSVIFFSIMT